jgi:pyrimidine oxygenase
LVPGVFAAHRRHSIDKEWTMTELGVFLLVGKNGSIVSAAAPQYQPSYTMLKAMTRLAEDLGFSFVLSPVKYRS